MTQTTPTPGQPNQPQGQPGQPGQNQGTPDDGLDNMTLDQLRDEAAQCGISVDSGARKADVLARLRGQA